ncbi:MAG: DUF3391 domain-containing protein [gamma proteobacterium symbiont of Bathyaustriella thionipta]|nr:DUF3391 domain-containing protein [gamma proteobacterium symbiont of Bathyaustriella thionipta]MCU7951551.1 DUF3391 domain-containing protein [gamma proteobacterium symbiont of Bathyaustriella thionipta]MCU7952183.1 DUF3391 domain-containing protein [gamma proteobacterium symbiont of Bathyaustriella thionipta]MCU7958145.1 DUF3391 domain-containing protein [gamma proteobacterium symbiont of Bathyaustriella thionipta]MCU7967744.1 DUF3391 domain-containing protein [gamma proteobacterium symbion
MRSALQKISIDELKVGMFIVEMDISWIKSPFLLHRRAIKTKNDIILLKKSGAKILTIDLEKGHIDVEVKPETSQETSLDETSSSNDDNKPVTQETKEISPELLDMPSVSLNEELNHAVILKEQALQAFNEINTIIKNNQAIPVKEFEPVIDETINSLISVHPFIPSN